MAFPFNLFSFRAYHHGWRRERSPTSHRGCCKTGVVNHQQYHADWRQEEISFHAANAKGKLCLEKGSDFNNSNTVQVNLLLPFLGQCTINSETTEPTDILSLEAVEFCQRHGSQSTKVSDIIGEKDKIVYQSIEEGIARVNSKATSNAQRIQKWIILGKDFSIVGGELGECCAHITFIQWGYKLYIF